MNNGPGSINRIFRLVWSDVTAAFVAVPENTTGRGKRSSGVVGALVVASSLVGANASAAGPPPVNALPTGGQVVAGQASMAQSGARLDVNQSSDRAAINWTSFNIGTAAQVNFNQPGVGSVALNRVVTGDASAIFGRLTANGQVLIVNPNGVVFGAGSQVDASGIAASTLKISDADFMAGKLAFTRDGATGSIVNQGTLTARNRGYVALLAPEVSNQGAIVATLGTVALASGDAVTLEVDGNKLLSVKVDPATIDALVENRSLIRAEGGQVIMSAGAANRLLEQAVTTGQQGATSLVSIDGAVRLVSNAGTVDVGSGKATLDGSLVDISGTVDASAGHGGAIAVNADWLTQGGTLRADGSAGRGGSVAVSTGHAVQTASALLSADGAAGGGSVSLQGGSTGSLDAGYGRIYTSATLQARGTAAGATGGAIDITADSVQLRAATVDASGTAGGGSLRIGGGFQGKDTSIANAVEVGINGTSVLRADAGARGHGGQAVVWSNGDTTFAGQLSATGGASGGDGGKAEVSGKGLLTFGGHADLSAAHGKAGTLLLDPHDIVIDDAAPAIAALNLDEPDGDALGRFGDTVKVLTNGNVVITAPLASTTVANGGAAYLYNSQTGALLAQLRGSHPNDQVGDGGVEVLANQNYIVRSTHWSPTAAATFDSGSGGSYGHSINADAAAGALTWQIATGGGSSSVFVSSANSLVGSTNTTSNDREGNAGMTVLSDGNLVFQNGQWNNGRGAVTWMNASNGHLTDASSGAVVSATNSFVGTTPIYATAFKEHDVYIVGVDQTATSIEEYAGGNNPRLLPFNRLGPGDQIGSGGITLLSGGAYVVSSPYWTNTGTTANYAGAASYGASGGSAAVVGAGNSLVGSHNYDFVGSGGIATVGTAGVDGLRPNYAVISPYWNSGGTFLQNTSAGAVTWVDGSNGHIRNVGASGAAIAAANSLVGDSGDMIGSYDVNLPQTYPGTDTHDWRYYYNYPRGYRYDPNTHPTEYSPSRITARGLGTADSVSGVLVLANGNYVVATPNWHNGKGSVTFGDGSAGVAGSVSATNSFVGKNVGDRVSSGGLLQLPGSRYAIDSPAAAYDNGSTVLGNAGAVTWAPATGIVGEVSASNSLVGDNAWDQVGLGGLLGVGAMSGGYRSNVLVLSPYWRNGAQFATGGLGAVTLMNGAAGTIGAVSASNSLVGSTAGDYIGSYYTSDSQLGGYNGNTGTYNSASGWRADLSGTVDVLANGNYVVRSENWSAGRGAATWGSGSTGVTGTISVANSLVGTTADVFSAPVVTSRTVTGVGFTDTTYNTTQVGDHVGMYAVSTPNSSYFVVSPMWSGGRGAVTWVDGSNGRPSGVGGTGVAVASGNSLVGSTADVLVRGAGGIITGIASPGDRVGTINAGDGTNFGVPVVSYVTSSGGSVAATSVRARAPYQLSFQSNVGYDDNAGSHITGANYSAGLGSLAATIDVLPNGNALVRSPNWNYNASATSAGAVTWVNTANGQLITGAQGAAVSSTNSLVGSHQNDLIGNLGIDPNDPKMGGIVVLANGNFEVRSPQWSSSTGAVSWGSATAGVTGVVSSSNSLVGSVAGDLVGRDGVVALPDNNAVVVSTFWTNYTGAVTWVNGANGHIKNEAGTGAEVGAGNSLVGSQNGDNVGNYGISVLAGGKYVVDSPYWSTSSVGMVGAVTWSPVGGIAGAVSNSNSLVGTTDSDHVGIGGVTVLSDASHTYTNYVVASPYWSDSLLTRQVGAVTWVDGSTGHVYGVTSGQTGAHVSSVNSLVGGTDSDQVGNGVQALTRPVNGLRIATGDAIVISNQWDLCTVSDYGAVSLIPGATGLAGQVGWRNSVLGMQWTANVNGTASGVNWEVLPQAATSVEKVTYRPVIWTQWGNSAAQVLSVIDEQTAYPVGPIGRDAVSVGNLDGTNWAAHSTFAGDAIGWAAAGGSAGLLAFGTNPGSNVVVTPGQITSMLDAGTAVTLQANNDITVAKPVIVSASGAGGDFTLQAGRSIHINANITTDNGNFTALANRSAADGVVGAQCETCVAQIVMAPGTSIDAGSGNVTMTLQLSADKTRNWLDGGDHGGVNSAGDVVLGNLRGPVLGIVNEVGSIRTNTSSTIDLYTTAIGGGSISLSAAQHVVLGESASAQAVTVDGAALFPFNVTSDTGAAGHGGIILDNVAVTTHGGDISLGGGAVGSDGKPTGYASLEHMDDGSLEHTVNGFLMQSGVAITGGTSLQAVTGNVTIRGKTVGVVSSIYDPNGGEGGEGGYTHVATHGPGVDISAGTGVSAGNRRIAIDGTAITVFGKSNTDANEQNGSGEGVRISGADLGATHATTIVIRGEQGSVNGDGYNTGLHLTDTVIGNTSTTNAITLQVAGFDDRNATANVGSAQIDPDAVFRGKSGSTLVVQTVDPTVIAQYGDSQVRHGSGSGGEPLTVNNDTWISTANLNNLLAQASGFEQLTLGRNDQSGVTYFRGVTIPVGQLANVSVLGGSGGIELGNTTTDNRSNGGSLIIAAGTAAGSGSVTADATDGFTLTAGSGVATPLLIRAGQDIDLRSTAATAVTLPSGKLVLELLGGGTVSGNSTTSITADKLLLQGGSASEVDLSTSVNQVTTLAANGGAIDFVNQGTLTIGTVADLQGSATHGVHGAQRTWIETRGAAADLIVNQAVTGRLAGDTDGMAAGDIVLAAGRNFTNNLTLDTGLDAGRGHYYVYSADPAATTEGMTQSTSLTSPNGYLWHYAQDYVRTAGAAPSTPTYAQAAGNWMLYRVAPVIHVGSVDSTITYGDADPVPTPVYRTADLINGDTLTLASITGTAGYGFSPRTGSATPSSSGNRVVGTYRETYTAGLLSGLGYTFAAPASTSAQGTLTVTQKDISLTGTRIYDGTTAAASTDLTTIVGAIAGDTLASTGSSSVGDKHVGVSKGLVGLGTLGVNGTDSANYHVAAGSLTITPRPVTLAADAQSKTYGGAEPALTVSIGGMGIVGGDTQADVFSGTPTTATGAAATAGTHVISVAGLAAGGDYQIVGTTNGTLTVAKAQLSVSPNAASKVYGAADPTLTYSVDPTQFKYTDTAAVVSGVSLSTATGAAATAGTHAITVAGGTADNYVITFAPGGSLTVAKAQLTIDADAKTKVYGAADPSLSYSVDASQLKYGDSASVVSDVTLATASGAAATAGTHAITVSGGVADNYVISIGSNGVLTVAKAQLTVRPDNQSKVYGNPDPTLTYSVDPSQLMYGDSPAVVSGVSLATDTGAAAGAGRHAITGSGGVADNYIVTVGAGGALTVSKATLTVTPNDALKVAGKPEPTLGYSVDPSQLKYGDTAAVVSGVTLAAPAASSGGPYPITASGGTAANYDVVFGPPGSLIVQAAKSTQVSAETIVTTLPQLSTTAASINVKLVVKPVNDPTAPGQLQVVDGGTASAGNLSVAGVNAETGTLVSVDANAAASGNGALTVAPAGQAAPAEAVRTGGTPGVAVSAAGFAVAPNGQLSAKPDLEPVSVGAGGAVAYSVPPATFLKATQDSQLTFESKLVDGSPLPSWLTFNPGTVTFSGTPPADFKGKITVDVQATDEKGATATTKVEMVFGGGA